MSIRRFIAGMLWLAACAPAWAQSYTGLRINEVMAANIDQTLDASGNYGCWVELYNTGSQTLNLQGLWVTDDLQQLRKARITFDCPVPGHSFAVLWFGHYDYVFSPRQLPMTLDADGGTVCLSTAEGRVVCAASYPPSISRCSWARTRDATGTWQYTDTPTPAASNSGSHFAETRLPAPEVSHESQIFSRTLDVQVAIPPGATLRYTTDGTTPTASHGEVSADGRFVLTTTRVYRFALFSDSELASPVVTRSFIRKAMNSNIPIVSIVTDPDHLYSAQWGVFTKGVNGRRGKGAGDPCNWNMDWDRPVNVEYFDRDGRCLLNMEAELSRCGGHSKGFTPYSFKLKATKRFEHQNYFPHQFFSDCPYLKHRGLQFRCGGNDYTYRLKDAALQTIVRTSGLDVDLQDYQPVCHYINGRFMGTINMREPNNRLNVYAHYGLDEDEIDLYEIDCDSGYVQMCGTPDAWRQLVALSARASDAKVYDQIRQLLHIDEFCNYMAVQLYLGNDDWPQNNLKAWRPIGPDGRFRFIIYDLDHSFASGNSFSRFAERQWHTFCQLYDVPDGTQHLRREVEVVPLFVNLLRNSSFRQHFITAFTLVAGSVFESKRCQTVVSRCASIAAPMQVRESGYPGRNTSPAPMAEEVLTALEGRSARMHAYLRAYSPFGLSQAQSLSLQFRSNIPQARFTLNGQPVPTGTFSGTVYLPCRLSVQAPAGWRFVGWYQEDTLLETSPQLTLNSPLPREGSGVGLLLARFERDELAVPPLVINEVSAANSIFVNDRYEKRDWVEIYNTTSAAVSLRGLYLTDDASQPRKWRLGEQADSAQATLPAGGFAVVWCDGESAPSLSRGLHANFRLSNTDGSCVILSAPDLSWSDTLVYCQHDGRQSVGRVPDGCRQLRVLQRPTICGSNLSDSYDLPFSVQPLLPTAIERVEMVGYDRAQMATSRCDGNLRIVLSRGNLLLSVEDDGPDRLERAEWACLEVYTLGGTLAMRQQVHLRGGTAMVGLGSLAPATYVARLTDSCGNTCSLRFCLSN